MTAPEPARQLQAAVAATIPATSEPHARPKRSSAVNGIARQFAGPSGPIGTWSPGARWPGNRHRTVPVFTVVRSAEEEPGCAPAASPRVRRRPSPWPTGAR